MIAKQQRDTCFEHCALSTESIQDLILENANIIIARAMFEKWQFGCQNIQTLKH